MKVLESCVAISRGSGWPRRFIAGLCATLLAVQSGCHTFLPIQESVPEQGLIVGVVLNDRGRVLVGERLGETVDRVDGVLTASSETSITLSVTRTRSLRGTHAVWTGESVVIPREGIRGFQERQFSRGRSVLLSVAIVVGVALVAGLVSLAVGGFGRGDGGGGDPPGQQ